MLIHCYEGRSRSAALLCAYLISAYSLTYTEAIHRIKEVRPVVNLNRGFEVQLRMYSKAHCNIPLAHQLVLYKRNLSLVQYRGKSQFYFYDSKIKKFPNMFQELRSDSSGQDKGFRSIIDRSNNAVFTFRVPTSPRNCSNNLSREMNGFRDSPRSQKRSFECSVSSDMEALRHIRNSVSSRRDRAETTPHTGKSSGGSDCTQLASIPYCQLSTPSAPSPRPVYQSSDLGQAFCCSHCSSPLFRHANIIRPDIVKINATAFSDITNEPNICSSQSLTSMASLHDSMSSRAQFTPGLSRSVSNKQAFAYDLIDIDADSNWYPLDESNVSCKSVFTFGSSPIPSTKRIGGVGFSIQKDQTEEKNISDAMELVIVHAEPPLQQSPVVNTMLSSAEKSEQFQHRSNRLRFLSSPFFAPSSITAASGLCTSPGTQGSESASKQIKKPLRSILDLFWGVFSRDNDRKIGVQLSETTSAGPLDTNLAANLIDMTEATIRSAGIDQSLPTMIGKSGLSITLDEPSDDDNDDENNNEDDICDTPILSTPRAFELHRMEENDLSNQFILLEYLPWMGTEVLDSLHESGILNCHNCRQSLGDWSWNSNNTPYCEDLASPFIRIDKKLVSIYTENL